VLWAAAVVVAVLTATYAFRSVMIGLVPSRPATPS
jgi:hypothetical protein